MYVFDELPQEVQEEIGLWSVKNIYDEAYASGYDKGYDAGYRDSQLEADRVLDKAGRSVND